MTTQRCAISAGKLIVEWNEHHLALDGALLRSHCRCAECRYQQLTNAEKSSAEAVTGTVTVVAASPLGYGVQLHFSDGHNRGIFPWSYLVEIARASPPL